MQPARSAAESIFPAAREIVKLGSKLGSESIFPEIGVRVDFPRQLNRLRPQLNALVKSTLTPIKRRAGARGRLKTSVRRGDRTNPRQAVTAPAQHDLREPFQHTAQPVLPNDRAHTLIRGATVKPFLRQLSPEQAGAFVVESIIGVSALAGIQRRNLTRDRALSDERKAAISHFLQSVHEIMRRGKIDFDGHIPRLLSEFRERF